MAQDPLEQREEDALLDEGDWGLAITPYAFLAAQSTDVGGEAIRQSFNDLASITNFGFQARLVARYKWLVFAGDGTYANLESSQEIGPAKADMDIKQVILDLKMYGKVYDSRSPEQESGVGIWAGARYWDNRVDVLLTIDPILPGGEQRQDTVKTVQSWWDPALGLVLHFPVTRVVGFYVRATGGGFGIGNASDYMWDAEFVALFRLSRRLLLSAGYRQFKYSRTDGDGEGEVKQTVSVVGPQVGLSIGIL